MSFLCSVRVCGVGNFFGRIRIVDVGFPVVVELTSVTVVVTRVVVSGEVVVMVEGTVVVEGAVVVVVVLVVELTELFLVVLTVAGLVGSMGMRLSSSKSLWIVGDTAVFTPPHLGG